MSRHHRDGQDDGASKVDRAASADVATGGHRRSILTKALHPDGTTRAGQPRRTGYKLVSEEPETAHAELLARSPRPDATPQSL